jgi:hemin uptake protein HemP
MMSAPIQPSHRASPTSLSEGAKDTHDTIPTVEVGSIIGTGREAVIVHKGERYRLRITANDKLILTK